MDKRNAKSIFNAETTTRTDASITPENLVKMLLEAGIDVGGYREPITLLQPCATEEDRQQLREALGQLYYEGNFTDGFTLKVRKF